MFPQHPRVSLPVGLALGALLLLGLLWLLNPTPPTYAQSQPQALGSLSGVVRNTQGDLLPNITVALQHVTGQYAERKATTNANGLYQFVSVYSGDYRLLFQDSGEQYAGAYYPNVHAFEDAAKVTVNGNAVTGVDMVLQLGGAISVTLQDADPVTTSLYVLTLYRQLPTGAWRQERVEATELGEPGHRLGGLAAGNYRLCATTQDTNGGTTTAECYDNALPDYGNQLANDASDIRVKAGVDSKVEMTLNDISQLQGFIRLPNHQPAAGINLTFLGSNDIFSRKIQTDEEGYFRFGYLGTINDILLLNYPYEGESPYLTSAYPDPRLDPNAPHLVIDGSTRLSFTYTLVPQSRITGKVTLPHNVPLSGASIFVFQPEGDGWMQASCYYYVVCPQNRYDPNTGVFTVTQLTAGRYRLSAQEYGGSSQGLSGYYGGPTLDTATDIVVAKGQTKSGIDITLGKNAFDSSISGRATASGQAIKGIEVGLFAQYFGANFYLSQMPFVSTSTDEDGRYRFDGLGHGGYYVGFRDPTGLYATTFYSNTINNPGTFYGDVIYIAESGETANIDVALTPGATIRGHVRTEAGQIAGGYLVQIVTTDTLGYSLIPLPYIDERSANDGSFAVSGLKPGGYFLRVAAPGEDSGYPQYFRYYANSAGPENARPITITMGQTLEDNDIYFFTPRNTFLPTVQGGASPGEAPDDR